MDLLAKPEELKSTISGIRLRPDLSEEERGFLILYDRFNGDTSQIRTYLNQTRQQIVAIPKKISERQLFYRIAAIFLVLFGTGIFFLLYRSAKWNEEKLSSQERASNIFKEPGIPILMGNQTTIDWAPLMFAIDKESPQKALQVWQKIRNISPDNDTVIYFGGIVQMNLAHKSEARKLFEKNAAMESVFADRSVYFLLQFAKDRGDQPEAKHLLDLLKNTSDMDLKPFVLQQRKRIPK